MWVQVPPSAPIKTIDIVDGFLLLQITITASPSICLVFFFISAILLDNSSILEGLKSLLVTTAIDKLTIGKF